MRRNLLPRLILSAVDDLSSRARDEVLRLSARIVEVVGARVGLEVHAWPRPEPRPPPGPARRAPYREEAEPPEPGPARAAPAPRPAAALPCGVDHGRGGAEEIDVLATDCSLAMTRLLAETLPLLGYREIRAQCPGARMPTPIKGAMGDQLPFVTCSHGQTPVLIDVFVPEEMAPYDVISRWQLFSWAAQNAEGEFHVAVPAWTAGISGRSLVERVALRADIRRPHVWEI
jgi:hypothetical protein